MPNAPDPFQQEILVSRLEAKWEAILELQELNWDAVAYGERLEELAERQAQDCYAVAAEWRAD